ncbi:M1 family aminopeptidase [Nonomuraea sp. NPDC052265]|uniref:M1 family aminopeptidase n=1 Tax=Nonomuraea sp. NPDC052265 TaxID=3364374 RepID=UPI0037C9271A
MGGSVVNENVGFALETQSHPVSDSIFFESGPDVGVVVHENAHQWFGDSVSVGQWRDIWLNEGFATYAEWLWSEKEGTGTAAELANAIYDPGRPPPVLANGPRRSDPRLPLLRLGLLAWRHDPSGAPSTSWPRHTQAASGKAVKTSSKISFTHNGLQAPGLHA